MQGGGTGKDTKRSLGARPRFDGRTVLPSQDRDADLGGVQRRRVSSGCICVCVAGMCSWAGSGHTRCSNSSKVLRRYCNSWSTRPSTYSSMIEPTSAITSPQHSSVKAAVSRCANTNCEMELVFHNRSL